MDWRQKYAHKLISPEQAAGLVRDGMTVHFGATTADPWYVAPHLHQRYEALREVVLYADLMRDPEPWDDVAAEERRVEGRSAYITPLPRGPYRARRLHYAPGTVFTEHRRYERDIPPPDIAYFHMAPPDEHGMLSFGFAMWDNKIVLRQARTVVAEVQEGIWRSAGDNFAHIDEVDYLVEVPADARAPVAVPPRRSPEEAAVLDICGAMAAELVRDGDTLEIGVGAASNAVAAHLEGKRDLGYHSELTSPGIAQLHEAGVFTGARKSRDPGKMVVTMLPTQPADLEAVRRNYNAWEVYGVDYIHNPSVIAAQSQMTAINTGTMIDLTGQIVFDSVGREMITGPGGQLEFVIGAVYAPGGRSIHVFPSAVDDESRIVCELPPGAVVGVPRYLADLVVTEHGVASLFGKTERARARELIAIAHPDHRADLEARARQVGLL